MVIESLGGRSHDKMSLGWIKLSNLKKETLEDWGEENS